MADLKLGATTPTALYVGSAAVQNVYLGATQVWTAGAAADYTLTAAAGSFTLTGNAITLAASRKLAASVASFTLTGNDIVFSYSGAPDYTLTANAGSFTLTGMAAALKAARKIAPATGSFTLTGNAAALTYTSSAADIKVEVIQVALSGSTGTQDITISGFGTPKAAMFMATLNYSLNTLQDYVFWSHGVTDGTNQWAAGGFNAHNTGATSDTKTFTTTRCIETVNGTGTDVEATFSTWITDGVRINVNKNSSSRTTILTVVLFGGADFSAFVDAKTIGAQDVAVTFSPGFQLSGLLSMSTRRNDALGGQANSHYAYGLASFDGSNIRQYGWLLSESSGSYANPYVYSDTAYQIPIANASYDVVELENITATTFDMTTRTGSNYAPSSYMGIFAIGLANGGKASAVVLDLPTATGGASLTDANVGFLPAAMLALPSTLVATDTDYADGTGAGWGISMVGAASEAFVGMQIEDAANPTNTSTVASDKAINLYDDAGTLNAAATFDSFVSDGINLTFTTAPASAEKMFALFLG